MSRPLSESLSRSRPHTPASPALGWSHGPGPEAAPSPRGLPACLRPGEHSGAAPRARGLRRPGLLSAAHPTQRGRSRFGYIPAKPHRSPVSWISPKPLQTPRWAQKTQRQAWRLRGTPVTESLSPCLFWGEAGGSLDGSDPAFCLSTSLCHGPDTGDRYYVVYFGPLLPTPILPGSWLSGLLLTPASLPCVFFHLRVCFVQARNTLPFPEEWKSLLWT